MAGPTVVVGEAGTPTFAEKLRADANRIERVTDDAGRVIGVKRLGALDMFDLTIAMGEQASNQTALNQALIVASVVEIDGEKLTRPNDLLQIRAMIQRLDFHGYTAVGKALSKFGAAGTVSDDLIKN